MDVDHKYRRAAYEARQFTLAFGLLFLLLTIACIVDRTGVLRPVFGSSFMNRWLNLGTDTHTIKQLGMMTGIALAVYGGMRILHSFFSVDDAAR
jgi:hypothetical protein